eukprot:237128-Amorphochlora_amoeboformis.AAC.1
MRDVEWAIPEPTSAAHGLVLGVVARRELGVPGLDADREDQTGQGHGELAVCDAINGAIGPESAERLAGDYAGDGTCDTARDARRHEARVQVAGHEVRCRIEGAGSGRVHIYAHGQGGKDG